MALRWYVVHAFSQFEKKVAASIKERVERHGMQDRFGEVIVPTEEVVEMKGGQKRKSERKFFPGYVLVQMELDDETWHLVKETPRVLLQSPRKKRRLFYSASRPVLMRPSPRRCLSPVKWCVLLTGRLMTSMALLKM
jgi:hypothetical protein